MLTKSEIRQLTDKDLLSEIEKVSKEIIKFRMDLEGGYEKASHKAKQLKKYHARLLTIKKENEHADATKSKKEEPAKTPEKKSKETTQE